MTTTQTTPVSTGLEDFGSSESVSNVSDFLSFEELGIDDKQPTDTIVDLPEVEREEPSTKVERSDNDKDVTVPFDTLGIDTSGIDLGEEEVKGDIGGVNYKAIVKELVDSAIWDGIEAFETENGSVPFDEMEIDKDTFVALMKHNQEELKNKLTSNSVSTEGISEFTQKLISIEKHGGNVQQALKAYQTVKQPLENLDISDVRGQKAICYLRLQQNNITGEEAKDLIDSYEIKGVLEDKAIAFKEQLDTAFNDWMLQQEEQAIKEEENYRQSLKTYKSSLNEVLKNAKEFELTETHRRKLLDVATKENESGEFELDALLDDFRRNPLQAAELLLFVTDKDTYIQKKAKTLLDEERKKTLKTISIIPKGKSSVDLGSGKTKADDLIIPLDKLI